MTSWRELTFPGDTRKGSVLVIDGERLKLLADPLRWRILTTLGEGKSVAEISSMLGITDTRILRHLELLVGLEVVHLHKTGSDPRTWRCLPAVGKIRFPDRSNETANSSEPMSTEVVCQFNQAFRETSDGIFGPNFQSSVNHNRARLSEDQAAEFNRRLLNLIEEYFPPGKGDPSGIKYGFFGVLTPIDLAPIKS